jgi:hypothetical protein
VALSTADMFSQALSLRKDTNMPHMITVLVLSDESQYATLLNLMTIARNEIFHWEWNSDTQSNSKAWGA